MMTTNYTHIFNDNLDMLPGYDFPSDMYELHDGSLVTVEELYDDYSNGLGWYEDEDGLHYEDDVDDSIWDYLRELEHDMTVIMERCGVYGAELWAELAAQYSDVHKDLYGFRPYDIGLRYHGM